MDGVSTSAGVSDFATTRTFFSWLAAAGRATASSACRFNSFLYSSGGGGVDSGPCWTTGVVGAMATAIGAGRLLDRMTKNGMAQINRIIVAAPDHKSVRRLVAPRGDRIDRERVAESLGRSLPWTDA